MADNRPILNRAQALDRMATQEIWDLIVIGGGATGLGVAVDAASRGFQTLLLERADFAKGTTSRSTKLVHGGVRYLAQGRIGLVLDALRERGILLRNAPHVVRKQDFLIPCYSQMEKWKYLAGLKLYDWLSGKWSFGSSQWIERDETITRLPGVRRQGLLGSVRYFDGQFDDARLAVQLAQTCADQGGVAVNYCDVSQLLKSGGRVDGVLATDRITGKSYSLRARVVVNATGVFVDDILRLDRPGHKPMIQSSQGIHLVFDASFFPGDSALMIPKTSDGRVLFAVPWQGYVLVGTTDTPMKENAPEPVALQEEIEFVLHTLALYLDRPPGRQDVLSVYAGLRPLVAPKKETGSSKEISRDMKLMVNPSGLITITGGKWTTYRQMAEATVDRAIEIGGLERRPSVTKHMAIHGSTGNINGSHLSLLGADASGVLDLMNKHPHLKEPLDPSLPYTKAEVIWAVRHEMALTVEDVLARRTRMLFLDARAALRAAPEVARLMAEELQQDGNWQEEQVQAFREVARSYVLNGSMLSVPRGNNCA